MDSSRLKHEGWLYGLVFLFALGLRLFRLGALPLTDAEAQWALQAWQLAQGKHPLLGSQVAYVVPTAFFFFVFGSFNFLARLAPALGGSALVWVPWLFRRQLRPRPALVLAFALAVEPGLLALSRQAGSPILAITSLLFAWGFWEQNRPRLAGVFAALALLSGPALWAGLLGLFITWAIRQGVEARSAGEPAPGPAAKRPAWIVALKSGLLVLILGGSLFFLSPNGLSAWLNALPEYLSGWSRPTGVGALRLVLTLLIYQPFAVVFAALAIGRGWRWGGGRILRLTLWLFVALALAVFYPAHQVSDLAWPLLPLWALAAFGVAPYLRLERTSRQEAAGVAAFTVFLLLFAWLDLTGLLWTPVLSPQASLRWVLLLGALLLLVVSLLLIAAGWSGQVARYGAAWGLLAVLGLYTLSAAWNAAELRQPPAPELWTPGARPLQADLLLQSVNDLSDWNQGHRFALPVTLNGVDSPALQWLLRDHAVEVVEHVVPMATPALLITPAQVNPGLESAYRGQDFAWRAQVDWGILQPLDWLRWLALRSLPTSGETILLWARQDVFLGSTHPIP
ncbi:MAG: hypothetical protein ACP5QU_09075 [Anaerolineae bacterium]